MGEAALAGRRAIVVDDYILSQSIDPDEVQYEQTTLDGVSRQELEAAADLINHPHESIYFGGGIRQAMTTMVQKVRNGWDVSDDNGNYYHVKFTFEQFDPYQNQNPMMPGFGNDPDPDPEPEAQ